MRRWIAASIVLLATRIAFAQTDDLEVGAAPAPKPSASIAPSASTPPPPVVLPPSPSAAPVSAPAQPAHPDVHGVPDAPGLVVSGYVQSQFEKSQLSEDQRQQGGAPFNQDRFLVRRGRLRVDRRWEYAAVAIELDGSTTRGPFFGVRRAEASLIYAGNPGAGEPPLATLTAGLSEIPFGHELVESSRFRWFMERSASSLAFFPGEPDVGVRLQGGIKFFRYAFAVLNGEPLNDRAGLAGGGRDFNKAKDLVARLGIDAAATSKIRIAGGLSFLTGKGFHPGTDATKSQVVWRDLNENSVVDAGEISAVPGTAATPSINFNRWAIGADLRLQLQTVLGLTRVYGEVYVASNLDRGTFFADPITNGGDLRHLGWYVAALQEFGKHVIVGFRADVYDPNTDLLDKRAGKLIPTNQTIRTLSPLVGLVLPNRARLLVQYDIVKDRLARDAAGVPVDLKNDLLTVRLQVEL